MEVTKNIIANTCTGAFLMRQMDIGNVNPFCWTIFEYDSIVYLLQNFDNINWKNIHISHKFNTVLNRTIYAITIDDNITILFPHIIIDNSCKTETIKDIDIHICADKIEQYLKDTYNRRIERMLSINEKPTFIISEFMFNGYEKLTKEQILNINKIANGKYNIIFCLPDNMLNLDVVNKIPQRRTKINAENIYNKYIKQQQSVTNTNHTNNHIKTYFYYPF